MALHGKKVTYSSHSSRAARAAHAKGDREFRTYDTSAIMPKKSPAPFICLGIVAVVVIAAVCFFAFRGCAGSQVELLAPGQSAEVTVTEGAVSYTHLDVYKRQARGWEVRSRPSRPSS